MSEQKKLEDLHLSGTYTLMEHLLENFGYPLIFFSYQISKVAICDVKVNKGHYLNQMTRTL